MAEPLEACAPRPAVSPGYRTESSAGSELTLEDYVARRYVEILQARATAAQDRPGRRGQRRCKEAISIRLDHDLLETLRASGPGWQTRVNQALRDWLERVAA